jgi:hypothetical protein
MLRSLFIAGLCLASSLAMAKDVRIDKVEMEQNGGVWTAHVTFKHDDTDFNHFVDGWRIVDAKHKVLAQQSLYHPHTGSKTFKENLAGIIVPTGTKLIYVEAHAKPHGWSKQRVRIDLTKAKGDRYVILRKNPRK